MVLRLVQAAVIVFSGFCYLVATAIAGCEDVAVLGVMRVSRGATRVPRNHVSRIGKWCCSEGHRRQATTRGAWQASVTRWRTSLRP